MTIAGDEADPAEIDRDTESAISSRRSRRRSDGNGGSLDPRPLELADLVAEPGGLFVVLEGDGQLELLLEPLERAGRPFLLDLAAPAEQEVELHAFGLAFFLVVLARNWRIRLIPSSICCRAAAKSLLASAWRARARRPHHRDIGPILVELDLVALAGRVLDHEGEEPQVPLGVAGRPGRTRWRWKAER